MSNNNHRSNPNWPPLQFDQIGPAELIGEGFLFTEGPLWNREQGFLLFSDISGNTIYKWVLPDTLEILRRPSNYANGLAYDRHGNLLAAEHGARRVSRLTPDGRLETLADNYQGRKFHSLMISPSDPITLFILPTPLWLRAPAPNCPSWGSIVLTHQESSTWKVSTISIPMD